METDRHNQVGGSLAARWPSIATRASVRAIKKDRCLDRFYRQLIIASDQSKVLTGTVLIMPNKRPNRRMEILEALRAGLGTFGILLDKLGNARGALFIRHISMPANRDHDSTPAGG
jgi:hypothetical protein